MDGSQKSRKAYRAEIDGLRAVAVIAVFINHLNPQLLTGGFLGVDIFFVISGFIITYTMCRSDVAVSPGRFIKNFYKKRIRRIIPALTIYVTVSFIIYSLFVSQTGDITSASITSLLGVSNLYFWKTAQTGYFGSQLELNPLTNTWSLGIEEQFYIVYPIFYALTRKAPKHILLTVYILAGALSFYFCLTADQNSSFFLPMARAWELLAGVITFYICTFRSLNLNRSLNSQASHVIGWLCLLSISLLFIFTTSYNQLTTGLIVLATSIFLWKQQGSDSQYLLCSKLFLWIGTRSYSIYLWHWCFIVIARWTLGLNPVSVFFIILLTFAVAEASYRLIEQPFRQGIFKQQNPITTRFLILLPLSLACLLLIYQLVLPSSLFLGSSPLLRREFNNSSIINKDKSKVLVIGESHADHLGGMVNQLNNKYGYDAIIYSYSQVNFPLTDHLPKNLLENLNPRKLSFYAKTKNLQTVLESLSKGDFLIISERGGLNLQSPGLETALGKILDEDINIIVIEPLLYFPDFYNAYDLWKPESCVKDWFRPAVNPEKCNSTFKSSFVRKKIANSLSEDTRLIRDFVGSLPKSDNSIAVTFNANEIICASGSDTCYSASAADEQIFRDDDHLTFHGSSLLSEEMVKTLKQITKVQLNEKIP